MATDLERLVISIEANTKQFERAINSLDGTTNRAMSRVESSMSRSGSKIGRAFGSSLTRAVASYLTVNFITDSVKASAEAGDKNARAFGDAFAGTLRSLQFATSDVFTQFANEMRDKFATIGRLAGTDIGKEIIGQLAKLDYEGIEQTVPGLIAKLAKQAQSGGGGLTVDMFKPPIYHTGLRTVDYPGREQLVALQQQLDLIGKTAEEQEVLNNVRQAGLDLSRPEAQEIARKTRLLFEQQQEIEALKDANNALEDSTKTFVQGLLQGESAADALNEALRRLADALLDMAFKSLFNPGGTPLLQSLFGGLLGIGNSPMKLTGSPGGPGGANFNTNINVSGSVDQKTLAAMNGMIQRNNARQAQELQRNWGNHQARFNNLRGP